MTPEKLPDAPITVTAIPSLYALEVTNPNTNSSRFVVIGPKQKIKVATHAERLAELNELAGQSTQDVDRLRVNLHNKQLANPEDPSVIHYRSVGKAIGLLANLLPPEVISHTGSTDKPLSVTIGNVAVCSRVPNEADLAATTQRILDQKKADTYKAEVGKTNLLDCAHAIVAVGEERFLLEILSPMAVLTARVIEHLQHGEYGETMSALDLARNAWHEMSLAERALFVEPESPKLYETECPALLVTPMAEIVQLTGQLEITRRMYGVSTATVISPNSSITYHETPLTEADASLRPVYPPRTDHEYIENRLAGLTSDSSTTPPQEHELAQAEHLLRSYVDVTGITRANPEQAIEIMDFVMTRRGKKAIETLLAQAQQDTSLSQSLASLHRTAKAALGYQGYQSAFRNRTIAGNHPTGDRSATTFLTGAQTGQATGAYTTTRWYIGDNFAPPLPKE